MILLLMFIKRVLALQLLKARRQVKMALDKASLITAIKNSFEDVSGTTAADKASALADAIDLYVKSGTVTVNVAVESVSGVTAGSGIAGAGTGTGTGVIY